MMNALREVRWTIAVTLVIGVFLSSSATDYALSMYRDWYDDTHPVVRMSGTLVERNSSTATIRIKGEKLRQCRFVSLHAYTRKKDVMSDAYKERLGRIEDGANKQVGQHDLGNWTIWPLDDADTVVMTVMHDCSGRLVTAHIAEVAI